MNLSPYPPLSDDEATTSPLPIPEPYKSGVRHQVPAKVTGREVSMVLLASVASGGLLIVGFDLEHYWQLGGYLGLGVALWQNGAAIALGASVVAMWRRRWN